MADRLMQPIPGSAGGTATSGIVADRTWHSIDETETMSAMRTSLAGLSTEEAELRRRAYGPNRLPQPPGRSAIIRFLFQFHNLLIYVLLVAAVLSAAIGHLTDSLVVVGVVLINAVIGFVQEGRAERSLDAIRALVDPQAVVVRDGKRVTVAAEDIVPGDVVLLEAGSRVPADLRLVRAKNLRIDEAALTGESVASGKSPRAVDAAAPLGDRTSMAFSGTFVAAGSGAGIAVATGAQSQLGQISAMIGAVEMLTTPLIRQMNGLARQLTFLILAGGALVFGFALLVRDYPWAEAFMIVIGMVVAAIPEGLPAVMTITLAIGVQRMAARNAIVRRLPAVETLGSVSVICSDKTGTLTRNEMMVRTVVTPLAAYQVTGVGYHPEGAFLEDGGEVEPLLDEAARAALLCNDAELASVGGGWSVDGDPMEGALISFAIKAGCDPAMLRKQFPRDDEIPFESEHKFMATLHHSHSDGAFAYIKGAPERVFAMCARQRGQIDEPLDEAFWLAQVEGLAAEGQRVLALAVKEFPHPKSTLAFADVEDGATLLGVVGLIDPPREEAIAAVRDCRSAGISVKMITGDHAATATAIARQLELAENPTFMTGAALDALDDAALREAARETTVFARASPEHKLRLVKALQADGGVIAMTGDGVNDAPALKRADVGVAMGGKGTEAAKEAAEIVLADDNFASIVAAVGEGRTVYDNLKKLIAWSLPTNGGEFFSILTAIAFGLTLPITAIQILWINMITTVTLGLTFAFEPTEPNTMRRPPRPSAEPLLPGVLLWRVGFVSLLVVAGTFGMFFWATHRGLPLETARSIAVNTIIVIEIFYLFSVRYTHGTSLTRKGVVGTPAVLIAIGVVVAAQFAFTYLPPMQKVFDTRSIAFTDGLAIVGVGVAFLVLVEIEKAIAHRIGARRGGAIARGRGAGEALSIG